ncbi:hypothetical protein ACW2Q0_08775 [Nocardia sp. R16R-3T]
MTAQMDGRAITNPENAQNFSHEEIKQAADQMNPDGLNSAFDAWAAIAAAVTKAGQQFETAIQQAVDQHWEGTAADRAVRGIREYAARVGELGESLAHQSTPLSAAASAAGRFKVAVPPVMDTSNNPESRHAQEEQARDDMSTLYIQPYGSTAPLIPTLPPVVDPISGVSGLGGSLGGSGDSSSRGRNSAAGGETGKPEGSDKAGDSGQEMSKAESTGGDSGTAEGTGSGGAGDIEKSVDTRKRSGPNGDTSKSDQSEAVGPQLISSTTGSGTPTTLSSYTHISTTSTAPATVSPQISPTTITSVGSTPVTSSPTVASPSPGSASDTGATPSPGKSVPGTTPEPTAAQPGTSAPSRVGATGSAGYSGMFPPGARSRRAEDGDHKSAAYLRTEEHGEHLIGEVDKTVPPVLGGQ